MPSTSHHSHMRQGFTLIELLVVISIIALLISILLPAMKKARDAGKNVADLTNLRSIGQAMTAYEADEGRYPLSFQETKRNFEPGASPTVGEYFANKLSKDGGNPLLDVRPLYAHYLGNANFFNCPYLQPVDRSLNRLPAGSCRVYGSYILAPGYWADYDENTNTYDWSKLWTRPQDQWLYAGYKVQVLAGDMFFREDGSRGYRFNHMGAVPRAVENIHPGSIGNDYCDSFFQTGIVPYDARELTTANFVLKDGSAATYQGKDERLIDFHNSGLTASYYLTPVLR